MGTLARFRAAMSAKLEVAAELAGLVFSVSGATLAVVLGKLIIGLVLGGIALGFVLRLKFRPATKVNTAPQLPAWARPVVAALAAVEVSALVEATNLPVRFSQDGFAYWHWYLVALAFACLYLLQLGFFRRLLGRTRSQSAA